MFRPFLCSLALVATFTYTAAAQSIEFDPEIGLVSVSGTNGMDTCRIRMDGGDVEVKLTFPTPTGSGQMTSNAHTTPMKLPS